MLGKKRLVSKFLGGVAKRLGKILYKRAAAGRARLVEHYRVHRAVFELDALHILTADIKHAVDVRVKEGRRRAVSYGLDLSGVKRERGLEQRLAVAGRAGADY